MADQFNKKADQKQTYGGAQPGAGIPNRPDQSQDNPQHLKSFRQGEDKDGNNDAGMRQVQERMNPTHGGESDR
jgi:hypothetical protein